MGLLNKAKNFLKADKVAPKPPEPVVTAPVAPEPTQDAGTLSQQSTLAEDAAALLAATADPTVHSPENEARMRLRAALDKAEEVVELKAGEFRDMLGNVRTYAPNIFGVKRTHSVMGTGKVTVPVAAPATEPQPETVAVVGGAQ